MEFNFSDGRGWPVAADGNGHSLVLIDSALLATQIRELGKGI